MDLSVHAAAILESWRLRQGVSYAAATRPRLRVASKAPQRPLQSCKTNSSTAMAQSTEVDDPAVSAFSDEAWEQFEERAAGAVEPGLTYGISTLDTLTGGLQPGQVSVVGARSGVGKVFACKTGVRGQSRQGYSGEPVHFGDVAG